MLLAVVQMHCSLDYMLHTFIIVNAFMELQGNNIWVCNNVPGTEICKLCNKCNNCNMAPICFKCLRMSA